MPYKLDGNCVVKADSGETVKCHKTHAEALAHLRALEANVADAKEQKDTAQKMPAVLDQQETAYTPVSTTPGQACAGCMWYRGHYCHIVVNYPENIEPTGWCNEYRVATPPPVNMDNPIPVVIVEPALMETDSAEMALPTTRRGLKELVSSWFKVNIPTPPVKTQERAFVPFQIKGNDNWYWIARHTGKWVDREDEIIANKSHDEYVERVQKGIVPMPELWTWHKEGTSHGVADIVWKSGGFVCAIGHFTGTKEQVARAVKYYQENEVKLSHMFKYPTNGKKNKVYYAYNTREITTLPIGAEAFPYTTFEGLGNMPFTKQMEDQIRAIGGDEMWQRAQAFDSKNLTDTTKLDAAGVASKDAKDYDNFTGSTIPGDDEIKALQVATKDFDARLKVLEALPATMSSLDTTLKDLVSKLAAMHTTSTQALEKANENEKKLLEYQALKPPASKSNDTLLEDREKSLFEQMKETAKAASGKSMMEQAFGGQPVVSGS